MPVSYRSVISRTKSSKRTQKGPFLTEAALASCAHLQFGADQGFTGGWSVADPAVLEIGSFLPLALQVEQFSRHRYQQHEGQNDDP